MEGKTGDTSVRAKENMVVMVAGHVNWQVIGWNGGLVGEWVYGLACTE